MIIEVLEDQASNSAEIMDIFTGEKSELLSLQLLFLYSTSALPFYPSISSTHPSWHDPLPSPSIQPCEFGPTTSIYQPLLPSQVGNAYKSCRLVLQRNE